MTATRAPMMRAGAMPPSLRMNPGTSGTAAHRILVAFITTSTTGLHAKSVGRQESANPESVDLRANCLTGAFHFAGRAALDFAAPPKRMQAATTASPEPRIDAIRLPRRASPPSLPTKAKHEMPVPAGSTVSVPMAFASWSRSAGLRGAVCALHAGSGATLSREGSRSSLGPINTLGLDRASSGAGVLARVLLRLRV